MDSQINQLIEKRMMRSEPMDDKLTLYRQQVEYRDGADAEHEHPA